MENHSSRVMHHQKSKNENKFFFSFYVVLAFDPIETDFFWIDRFDPFDRSDRDHRPVH
jgi:hypothetical protein